MNEDLISTGSTLTEGMIITVFADFGPENIYNSSPLDNSNALKTTVKNLTAIGSDEPHPFGVVSSHGPLPTSRKPYLALGFLFNLKAEDSTDPRVVRLGRIVVFWIISRSSAIVKYKTTLKLMIQRLLQFYQIDCDTDLLKEDVMQKIDNKLQIIEGEVETYYITEEKTVETFLDLVLVPPQSPIILANYNRREIQILLRDETSPIRKSEIRQIVNDYVKRILEATYKFEWVSDPVRVQMLLSKLGFGPQTSVGDDFVIQLFGQLTLEKLDDFLASRLASRRRQLASRVLQSVETETSLDLRELATETGMFVELIEQLFGEAAKVGLIPGARIENGIFYPPTKPS